MQRCSPRGAPPLRITGLDSEPRDCGSEPSVHRALRIVALGGLGEVGMNCLVIEAERRLLVIDCGVTFPDHEPGIELIHPDFGYLKKRAADVEAIVLTHGHEDHIGALPY